MGIDGLDVVDSVAEDGMQSTEDGKGHGGAQRASLLDELLYYLFALSTPVKPIDRPDASSCSFSCHLGLLSSPTLPAAANNEYTEKLNTSMRGARGTYLDLLYKTFPDTAAADFHSASQKSGPIPTSAGSFGHFI
jgi:hypothetical protein